MDASQIGNTEYQRNRSQRLYNYSIISIVFLPTVSMRVKKIMVFVTVETLGAKPIIQNFL